MQMDAPSDGLEYINKLNKALCYNNKFDQIFS